jgi:hypothetical protein
MKPFCQEYFGFLLLKSGPFIDLDFRLARKNATLQLPVLATLVLCPFSDIVPQE